MNEVSSQTTALVVDGLERRGVDVGALLDGLGVTRDDLARGQRRIDWETWVAFMERAEAAAGGPNEMPWLFAPGAGGRTGHPFVRLASSFLTLEDIYRLFARWGIGRTLMVAQATFEPGERRRARFELRIDPTRTGSSPTMRFAAGILRHLPRLQGLPDAEVTVAVDAHVGTYDLVLPAEASLFARARRVLGVLGGTVATLEELDAQTQEILSKNTQLEEQLGALRETEATLRERDEWLGLALDAGRVAIWSLDQGADEVRASDGLRALLGLDETRAPISVAAFVGCVVDEDRERVTRALAEARVAGSLSIEYAIVRSDGLTICLHNQARALLDASGRPRGLVGTVTDITEQKRLEKKLDLAGRLIAAGTLAAGVAHEINNPLTYVTSNVELLRRALADGAEIDRASLDDSLAEMEHGLVRIRDVVRDLRTFSRPEEAFVSVISLARVSTSAIRVASHALRHRASLETSFAPDTPFVTANESRLGQVVVNLLINAAQAMPDRPLDANVVRLRTARGEDGAAVLEVEDNGDGIRPEHLPRVFDPFFTTKRVGEGTGLGLSVCQGIVSALGGALEVESRVGVGSTFRVRLPGVEPSLPPPSPSRPPLTDKLRVLVVDDEPLVRKTTARLLTLTGFEVFEASGGREGLERALGDAAIGVVLCDLMMPDVDGIRFYDELVRARPDLARCVVFLTGGAVTDRAKAFLEGVPNPCVEKPFTTEHLLSVIHRTARTV